LARAAVAAGADGILVDVHPTPDTALVDGAQALLPSEFAEMMVSVNSIATVLGRII
jgi:3-deoxy-7-phosphoheptulonate synthase